MSRLQPSLRISISSSAKSSADQGRVIDRIKGGLTVDILGARAFLPGSQVDLRPVRNLDGMKGQTIEVAIIKLNKKRGNIVVSRKQLLEEEQSEKRAQDAGAPGRGQPS